MAKTSTSTQTKTKKPKTKSASSLPAVSPSKPRVRERLAKPARHIWHFLGDWGHVVLLIILAAATVAVVWYSAQAINQYTLNQKTQLQGDELVADHALFEPRFKALQVQVKQLQATETQDEFNVANNTVITSSLNTIQRLANQNQFRIAGVDIAHLKLQIAGWQQQITNLVNKQKAEAAAQAAASGLPAGNYQLPILLYHNPPADLATQFAYLVSHHYNPITPDQMVAGLTGKTPLPSKPVLITFDDGYETQLSVLPLLEQYHLIATFYIIDGGQDSDWHIGANRVVPDPQGGPDYLTWDQIRMLDKSGYVTIGSHTVDHLDLAQQGVGIQQFEIFTGKSELESRLVTVSTALLILMVVIPLPRYSW